MPMKCDACSAALSAKDIDGARALGATEFIPKPAQPQHLRRVLLDTLRIGAVAKPLPPVAQLPPQADPLAALIGRSPPLLALKTQVSLYADSPFPVLITPFRELRSRA